MFGLYERAQYFPTIDSNIVTSECYKYFFGKPCTSISLDWRWIKFKNLSASNIQYRRILDKFTIILFTEKIRGIYKVTLSLRAADIRFLQGVPKASQGFPKETRPPAQKIYEFSRGPWGPWTPFIFGPDYSKSRDDPRFLKCYIRSTKQLLFTFLTFIFQKYTYFIFCLWK